MQSLFKKIFKSMAKLRSYDLKTVFKNRPVKYYDS